MEKVTAEKDCSYKQLSLFPQCFATPRTVKTKSVSCLLRERESGQKRFINDTSMIIDRYLIGVIHSDFLRHMTLIYLNPFPNKPLCLRVCCTSLSKTLWEKEKLLVTSNFSFSHSVFYPFGLLTVIFIKSRIVVSKLF